MNKIAMILLIVFAFGFLNVSEADAKIARVWHGKVKDEKSQEYQKYISDAIKGFKKIKGNQGYVLLKESRDGLTHFMVISYWDSKQAIEAYAGKDVGKTHFLPRDREFLVDPEESVMNYEFVANEMQK